jgi:low affinity Fe/Cu permease
VKGYFRAFSEQAARAFGSPWAFLTALGLVLVWALSGPWFNFSQTWQMIINTGTTVVTLLMVFLLQGTQLRDTKALHLKLDELLRAVQEARTGLVGLEQLPDEQLQVLAQEFTDLGNLERSADQAAGNPEA